MPCPDTITSRPISPHTPTTSFNILCSEWKNWDALKKSPIIFPEPLMSAQRRTSTAQVALMASLTKKPPSKNTLPSLAVRKNITPLCMHTYTAPHPSTMVQFLYKSNGTLNVLFGAHLLLHFCSHPRGQEKGGFDLKSIRAVRGFMPIVLRLQPLSFFSQPSRPLPLSVSKVLTLLLPLTQSPPLGTYMTCTKTHWDNLWILFYIAYQG